ncbi:MAG: hypothetical protein AB1673_08525 [Actinomycetota bacterium]
MAKMTALMAAALLVVAAACGDTTDQGSGPGTNTSTTQDRPPVNGAGPQECTAAGAYRVEFPGGWHTNAPDRPSPCRYFHPEPFTLPEASEATGIAVHFQVAQQRLGDIAPGPSGNISVEVLDRREAQVDGRPAVRAETRSTGQGLLGPGVRGVSWYVDHGPRTVIATTTDVATAGTFEGNVDVLDSMVSTVRLLATEEGCSASGATRPAPQPGLPAAVAEMRAAILDAALECDYDELAELAQAGAAQFVYSFGGGEDPAGFWRDAEEGGRPVLGPLVHLLGAPSASRPAGPTDQYVWPSAFAYDSWAAVPVADREALRPLYDDEDFAGFAQFGSYAGLRVGITATGDWVFYVAGD